MCLRALAVILLWLLGSAADAEVLSLSSGQMLKSPSLAPPSTATAWQDVVLPDEWRYQHGIADGTTLWYRFELDWPADAPRRSAALYIPYLSNGGDWSLNGQPLARLTATDHGYIVRWVRPHLIALPAELLHPGRNVLHLRTVVSRYGAAQQLPQLAVGEESLLRPQYDQRLFLVHTMPLIAVVATLIISAIFLAIWWRRRQERIYGLLGLTTLLWGIRTLTIVMEFLPVGFWPAWRVIYHAATGGFVVGLALFVLQLTGVTRRWLHWALLIYWSIGPLLLLIDVSLEHPLIAGYWSLGLLVIGSGTLLTAIYGAFRERSWQTVSMCAAMGMAWIAGLHDFLVDKHDATLVAIAPGWVTRQVFLLHHAANLMLLVLAGILITRLVQSIEAVDVLNATLRQRIAEREQQLAKSYEELSRLSRERAVEEERERLARDMHDGLGSRLFTSWSRVQREAVSHEEMKEMLHESITEMRLALDALSAPDDDFQAALGNLRYRWEADLRKAGIQSSWHIDELKLPAHQRLHVLRILQEALTNVLKHAKANKVTVRAIRDSSACRFEVSDDGCAQESQKGPAGIGVNSMRARAAQLGGTFDFERNITGTLVTLVVPGTLQ
jgi:signal transduction histidine kinase